MIYPLYWGARGGVFTFVFRSVLAWCLLTWSTLAHLDMVGHGACSQELVKDSRQPGPALKTNSAKIHTGATCLPAGKGQVLLAHVSIHPCIRFSKACRSVQTGFYVWVWTAYHEFGISLVLSSIYSISLLLLLRCQFLRLFWLFFGGCALLAWFQPPQRY